MRYWETYIGCIIRTERNWEASIRILRRVEIECPKQVHRVQGLSPSYLATQSSTDGNGLHLR